MQLYEVWFQLHFGKLVDVGRVLVCAQDQTKAKETVIAELDLPVSALTRCDVKRIKPNLFLLERKEVVKPDFIASPEVSDRVPDEISEKGIRATANRLAENREYKREMAEYVAQQRWAMANFGKADDAEFECRILACVIAPDEGTVLRRLAGALRERSFGVTDNSRHVKNVSIYLTPDYDQR